MFKLKPYEGYSRKCVVRSKLDLYIGIPPANKVWGVYRNHPVHPSVRPSMYLVSATPPKPLIGFL